MSEQKKGFFEQGFEDMKAGARVQREIDRVNFEAIKAENKAKFEEIKAKNKRSVVQEKAQAERQSLLEAAQQRKEKADAHLEAVMKHSKA